MPWSVKIYFWKNLDGSLSSYVSGPFQSVETAEAFATAAIVRDYVAKVEIIPVSAE